MGLRVGRRRIFRTRKRRGLQPFWRLAPGPSPARSADDPKVRLRAAIYHTAVTRATHRAPVAAGLDARLEGPENTCRGAPRGRAPAVRPAPTGSRRQKRGQMDLLSQIRRAALRGEVGSQLFVALCERLLAKGERGDITAVLAQAGLSPPPTVTGELGALGFDSLEAGQSIESDIHDWVNADIEQKLQFNDGLVEQAVARRADASANSALPRKYALGKELARGGVGRIDVVSDSDLMRTLVLKRLIDGHGVSDYVLQKFIEEAQITAQLEHPNIVPVHDFGYFSGGEVFFTMKLVEGRTLKDIIRALRKREPATTAEYPRLNLLNIFRQICMAIGFANSKGVVHRDIKPSNVMIGEYGETLVLDWGVAKVIGRAEDATTHQVSTSRSLSEDATMVGVVTGTPAYMAPEQAAGKVNDVDERADVYALGAVLYEILAFRAPFRGKNFRQVLAQVLTQPPPPPSARTPQNNVPPALDAICMRCLEKRPDRRYATAKEIIAAIDLYLAGVEDLDRRARLSRTRLDEGLDLLDQYLRSKSVATHLEEELLELEWGYEGHEPIEQKRPLWAKQAGLEEAQRHVHQQFAASAQAFMASIGFNPDNQEACNELARLYWFKMRDAEQAGDEGETIYYRGLVEAYNRGVFDDLLKGRGRIVIRSYPTGARVTASRYLEVDQQLTTLMEEALGQTALNNIPLAQGSWLLRLQLPGYRDVLYPAQVDRGEVTDVICRFFKEAEIGTHYLYVPGGAFAMGGDDACTSARHRRRVEVGDFFISRYPVTCGEYLAFIHELDMSDRFTAHRRVPRLRPEAGHLWVRDANGRFCLPAVDAEGFQWDPYWPVFGISFEDAQAYCAWYTRRAGVQIRLPTEEEWEKAARGNDARPFPWGARFDPTFCKMAASRQGQPMPERVGSFASDQSPYGIYDMAGLVSEYCDSPFSGDSALRVVKGGNYREQSAVGCRVSGRHSASSRTPSLTIGFRVVRDVPQAAQDTARRLVRPSFE